MKFGSNLPWRLSLIYTVLKLFNPPSALYILKGALNLLWMVNTHTYITKMQYCVEYVWYLGKGWPLPSPLSSSTSFTTTVVPFSPHLTFFAHRFSSHLLHAFLRSRIFIALFSLSVNLGQSLLFFSCFIFFVLLFILLSFYVCLL